MTQRSPSNDVFSALSMMFSLAVGVSAAFLVYVAFLQTPVLSKGRLLLALGVCIVTAGVNHALITRHWKERLRALYARQPHNECGPTNSLHSLRPRLFASCFLVPLLFLPFFYVPPAYPTSPLLRPWSDIAVQFALAPDAQAASLGTDVIRLVMDRNVLDARSFERVGNWNADPDALALAPGLTASLHWAGPIARTATLTVVPPRTRGVLTVYWDASRLQFDLPTEVPAEIVLVRKFTLPPGVNAALFLSWYFLLAWLLLVFALLPVTPALMRRVEHAGGWLFWLLALILAAITVKLQVDSLDGGMNYLYTVQIARHQNVLRGTAPDPWQYRLLSEWIAEGALRLFQSLGASDPIAPAFLSLRVAQNLFIFVLAFGIYRRLTGSPGLALMGMLLLAGAMKNAFYDNDLSFNTYFDLLFYLAAVMLILQRRHFWAAFLMVPAALNRETSGLIPILLLLALIEDRRSPPRRSLAAAPAAQRMRPNEFVAFVVAALVFIAVFLGVRFSYPPRPLYVPYEQRPGIPLFLYNVTRAFTWEQLFRTLGFIPLLAGLSFFALPRLWRNFFLVLPPIWFGIHFFLSVVGETRLFLVPQAVVFLPSLLLAWNRIGQGNKRLRCRE